jgi:DNA-binding beta-propeller fold protein YncE
MLYRFAPSGRLETRIELGPESWQAAVTEDGSLWGNNFGDGTIWRVDPDTNQAEFVPGWTGPENVVASGHELWVGDGQQHSVTEWDTVSRQTVGFVRGHSGEIVVTPNAVWILNSFSDTLTKVDPDTDQILQEFQLGYSSDMVAGDGSLWVSAGSD